MKPKDQVCSLQLAKKLLALGVKQDSLFYWQGTEGEIDEEKGYGLSIAERLLSYPDVVTISAFTATELGELLPTDLTVCKVKKGWSCYFHGHGVKAETSQTEADARAKMVIHLIEKRWI